MTNRPNFFAIEPFVLASGSARRAQLLQEAGCEFVIDPADIDETPSPNEQPTHYVKRMALEKAQAVAKRRPQQWVLAADTTVVHEGEIFGKPANLADCQRILRRLSDSQHQVISAFCLSHAHANVLVTQSVTTDITFSHISDEQIQQYWQTGEPQDKAGSYALQGIGGLWVVSISGSVSNVIGLPMVELLAEMKQRLPKKAPIPNKI